MPLLSWLERRFGRFAVPNLTLALIVCQVVTYAATNAMNQQPGREEVAEARLMLIPDRVLDGEVWRLVTFLLLPPGGSPLVAFCFWYFFWLMGSSLEAYWGAFRYNLYLATGYLATVAAGFPDPAASVGNAYLESTVFLAFAWLNPDFPIYLFFVLAVPIKWLARITWAVILLTVVFADWAGKGQAVAAVANFLLFFGREIIEVVRTGRRHMHVRAAAFAAGGRRPEYHHRCRVCGATDRTHKGMDFRYCSKCAGGCCYCAEHLRTHEHVAAGEG